MASKKGLLAAAGPQSVVIASTEAVRRGFQAESSTSGDIKPFSPQLTIPVGTRVSQVIFSSDERFLAISAEAGGGLAIYDVDALMQGNARSTFELSSNGTSIRALSANPAAESAELLATVTTKGELMMANLKNREFMMSPQGSTVKEGVSCLSWSNKGKQLIAGLGDGTCCQMTPTGEAKGLIPKPPNLEGDQHVSSISWLENNVFLLVHTPSNFDAGIAPTSVFHIASRPNPQSNFVFQKLPEVCSPFGLNRSPPYHFLQRLKDFPPNIQDVLLVASTASQDIGVFSRSKEALTSDIPADRITNVFTTTVMANDARRAQLMMTEDMSGDTSPIGVALDLSSQERVPRPLPAEEMDESPGPLPAYLVLNNEGILAAWWFVYADSIRQGSVFPGLVAAENQKVIQPLAQTSRQIPPFGGATQQQKAPAFGQNTFGAPSSSMALGSTPQKSAGPAFGATTAPGNPFAAFGAAATPGNSSSPWGVSTTGPKLAGTTFGQPSLGAPAQTGSKPPQAAFGATGGLGNRSSPWAVPAAGAAAGTSSAFGQSTPLGSRPGSAFGQGAGSSAFGGPSVKPTTATPSTGGFASFAKSGGFAATAAAQGGSSNIFGQTMPSGSGGSRGMFGQSTPSTSFGSGMDTDTTFGNTPKRNDQSSGPLFGAPEGFKLGSTFKGDGTAKDDGPKPPASSTNSFFGGSFGNALGDSKSGLSEPQSKETDMVSEHEGGDDESSLNSPTERETTTPADTPATLKSVTAPTAPPVSGGLFGTQAQGKATPAAVQNSTPAGFTFGQPPHITTTPKETPQKSWQAPKALPETPSAPTVKLEPETRQGVDKSLPEAPLPPNPTSKASYTPGGSSASSSAASKTSIDDTPLLPDWSSKQISKPLRDAPLPPDFLMSKKKPKSSDDAPLPPDFIPSKQKPKKVPLEAEPDQAALPTEDADDEGFGDEEGSGVDVAEEVTTDNNESLKESPESSFGGTQEKSPLGGLFSKVQHPDGASQHTSNKPLFGEVQAPIFPLPSKIRESPRSPSPVRSKFGMGRDLIRPDASRSLSAPGFPSKPSGNRVATMSKPLESNLSKSFQAPPQSREVDVQEKQAARLKQQQIEEEQDLSDREDEKVREELATDVEPTLSLGPFLAHQDYVGNINKPGIPGQIEKVYRDINSMIDTLGLNARSLTAFSKGHEKLCRGDSKVGIDLDNGVEYVLGDIAGLKLAEDSLEARLGKGRAYNLQEIVEACRYLRKDLVVLNAKFSDTKRIIDERKDPKQHAAVLKASLSAEQITLQHDVRKGFTNFQQLLVNTEEQITVLRAKIASIEGARSNEGSRKMPTVEAVTQTIKKMTSMVEAKSGDIDVLENQMRKLGMNPTDSPPSSREASPFVTPPTSVKKDRTLASRTPGSHQTGSNFYTPESGLRASIGVSRSDSPRKKIGNINQADIESYGAKYRKRQVMNEMLKEAVKQKGFVVRGLDDA